MAEAHPGLTEGGFSFSPDPDYCRLIEFYCPHCGITLENEYLPPGHPITHEIELDVSALKRRHGVAEARGIVLPFPFRTRRRRPALLPPLPRRSGGGHGEQGASRP